jgi:hypothetical protein
VRRLLPVLTALITLGLPAVAAHAVPSATFSLSTPSPCFAGYCSTYLTYAATEPVGLLIDWDHQGPVDGPLNAGPPVPCAPGYGCGSPSPAYTTAGDHTVVLEVQAGDGSKVRSSQVVGVVDLPPPPAPYTPPPIYTPPTMDPYDDAEPVQPRPVRKPTRTPSRKPTRTPTRKPSRGGDYELCRNTPANVKCQAGGGRQTAGGGEKVSHKGWPRIDGVFWQVMDSTGRKKTGGPDNDELLGHHGSDVLNGGAGKDVLWGDWDPANNNTHQRDVLRGGAGNDFIYPSHGPTQVDAGPGKDYIWAFYGKGTIDCGPGYDTVRVRTNGAFKLRGCEVVGHFCQHGPNGKGGCLKPGETRATVRRSAVR